jgi:magnesium chelatase subunit I
MRRRDAYENDYAAFMKKWRAKDSALRKSILAARAALPNLKTPNTVLHDCAALCIALGSDGLRGELTLLRAARAQAAFEGADAVGRRQLKAVAVSALGHRLRRDPLDEAGSSARVARLVEETLP